jgi:hypothetical protein
MVSTNVNGTSSTFVKTCSKTGRSRCDELGEESKARAQLKGRCQADPSKISFPQGAETKKVDKVSGS